MISVSDILARLPVVQAENEGPGPACLDADEPASALPGELLSFITRFAAVGTPLPVLRPALRELPAEDESLQPEHVSHDLALSLLESEVVTWSIEQNPALFVLFDAAKSGMALPPNGESVPDDAAIVVALLDGPLLNAPLPDAPLLNASPQAAETSSRSPSQSSSPAPAVQSEPVLLYDRLVSQTAGFQSYPNNEPAVAMPEPVLINRQGGQTLMGPMSPIKEPGASDILSSSGIAGVFHTDTLATTADASRPTLAGVAEAHEGASLTKMLAAFAESGSTGQESHTRDLKALVPPLLTPARTPAPASPPASPATTEQARTMDFLLQSGGLDRTWGRERWAEGLGQHLRMMTSDGISSARLRLDPPSLGMLTIQIQMTEQGTSVSFVAQHPAVRDALEQHANRLQELFQDQELNLLDVSVSDQDTQEREAMAHMPEPWQEAVSEADAEEHVVETHSHHLIDERV